MNKQMYTFGGRTNVRGNEMYDFMRSKYRPLSSQKNAIRYQYPRAASHDRAAAAVAQARNNPMIRTSYEDNFKKGAQQIPYPFHPRPTAQTMAAKQREKEEKMAQKKAALEASKQNRSESVDAKSSKQDVKVGQLPSLRT